METVSAVARYEHSLVLSHGNPFAPVLQIEEAA